MGEYVLNIALDLGSDTLKAAFAYVDDDGAAHCGKLVGDSFSTRVAIPAVARYDENKKEWRYGDDVGRGDAKSFVTVVKIKSLLSLVEKVTPSAAVRGAETKQKAEGTAARNRQYYARSDHFPRFAFPRRSDGRDYATLVATRQTFRAQGYTPQSVCEGFFSYVAELIVKKVKEFSEAYSATVSDIRLIIVYPAKAGEEYMREYERLVAKAFGRRVEKRVNSIKALSLYALCSGAVGTGDTFLIFDMGEEDISVAKAALVPGASGSGENGLTVDAADGHNPPCDIGGNDIDEAVARHLEFFVQRSETPGTPSYGTEGHITEHTLDSKQYLFLKNIKDAKAYLGMENSDDAYALIGIQRALYMQGRLTGGRFRDYIGCGRTVRGASVSRQIADYVLTELRRPFNADVTKLLFAGGLTETYGLMDFIKEEVDKAQAEAGRTPVETLTLSVFAESGSDEFSIRPYEDSVYAAAAGAAIMLALGYELRTVLALSYGTWFRTKLDPAGSSVQRSVKTLEFFAGAQKGDPIRESFLTASVRVGGSRIQIGTAKYSPYIEKEEMFSTFLTQKDIERYVGEVKSGRMRSDIFLTAADSDPVMAVGDPGSALRSEAVAKAGLRTVTGGEKSRIMFWYRGRRVAVPVDLRFREGIHMDADGRATPIIGTRGFFDTAHAKDVWQVVYLNDDFTQSGGTDYAYEADIVVAFDGLDTFDTGIGGGGS